MKVVKTITLLAVTATLLYVSFTSDDVPEGRLTGPIILFSAALAVAIYEAWAKKRGAVGWFLNIVAAILGGFFVSGLCGVTLSLLHLRGAVVRFLGDYIGASITVILVVFGSWLGLQSINQFRDGRDA
jgi:ethanolamine transporter EutH